MVITVSAQQSRKVEGNIRSRLLESPRVKSLNERERFAKHLLCGLLLSLIHVYASRR